MTTELQNHFEIKSEIKAFQERREKLVQRADELHAQVQNTIVFPIERKSYKTTCKECP
jgi:hypothetical protein